MTFVDGALAWDTEITCGKSRRGLSARPAGVEPGGLAGQVVAFGEG
jgi:hypothetical protein